MISRKTLMMVVAIFAILIPLKPAHAQFIEEVGTLESLYELRARAVLNSFLRPNEYTVVVSADIERDEQKLKEYREKLEVQFLPGLPIPADPQMMPAQDKLHAMKTKIEIQLVLAQEVPADKEKLLKDVLMQKLHLDESTGDKITVARSALPKENPQKQPQILPEFSWKTWSLILLLALLALAGIIFWANRRQQAQRDDDEEKKREEKVDEILAPEALAEVAAINEAEQAIEDEKIEEDISASKDRVIAMASQYPQIASRVARELIEAGREVDMVNVMETIGWDTSKKLFNNLGPRAWGRVGVAIRKRETLPVRSLYKKSMSDCHRLLLSRVLEQGGEKDDENPFTFLVKASSDERRQLLKDESPQNLAVISWFCSQGELSDYFDSLDVNTQSNITLAMARLDELPSDAILVTSQKLVESLRQLRQRPVMKAEGPRLAAKVLRTFAPEKEMEIMSRLTKDSPQEAGRISRATVQFGDLNVYPTEILSEAIADVDTDTLRIALTGADQKFALEILAVLPKKKAMMVERDLMQPNSIPPASQVGLARRTIVSRVEISLATAGLSLDEVWLRADNAKNELKAA